MRKLEIPIGKVFGRLTILNEAEPYIDPKYGSKVRMVNCKCSCENNTEIVTRYHALQTGNTTSCGCLSSRHSNVVAGEVGFRLAYLQHKNNAKSKNRLYLSEDEFRFFTQQNCYYCGVEPTQVCKSNSRTTSNETKKRGEFRYNGIDRYINSIDYVVSNCVPCCGSCNDRKGTMDGPEFESHVLRITDNLNSKKDRKTG